MVFLQDAMDMIFHFVDDFVPGVLAGQLETAREVELLRGADSQLAERNERLGRRGDLDDMAEIGDDVGDSGGNDGPPRGEIFEGLGGIDKFSGLVQGEGHEAGRENAGVIRKGLVFAAADPEKIGPAGEMVRVNFGRGADHDDVPMGIGGGEAVNESVIEPLIDDAEIAKNGGSDEGDIGRSREGGGLSFVEMFKLDAAAVEMGVAVKAGLGLVELAAAAKDDMGGGEKLAFADANFRGSKAELGELIHAIVNHRLHVEVADEAGRRHGVVEPMDGAVELAGESGSEFLLEEI